MEPIGTQIPTTITREFTVAAGGGSIRWDKEECQAMQDIWKKHLEIHQAADYLDIPWCKHQNIIAQELHLEHDSTRRTGSAVGIHVRGRKCKHGCADLQGPKATKEVIQASLTASSPHSSSVSTNVAIPIFTSIDFEEVENSPHHLDADISFNTGIGVEATLPMPAFISDAPIDEEMYFTLSPPPELFSLFDAGTQIP